ncbi:reverse transcriptase domain-containing protein [Tanacetum coccineum]
MTDVPRHIAEHRLNVRKGCSPVRQKKKGQATDRNQAIQEEVEKLVEAGIIREVHYHDWLSNSLMVKKHDNSWRMCVDFKDLNKACPKDGYPLPEIDWKVESLCGFPFKCFLDAYKGYHQIQMAKEDEEKTAFITSQGIFCYTKMPFGLRNAGSTYQRLVDKAFHKQIGRNLEVYVDDLVIKSRTEDEIVRDMEETFQTLREINMKLNPKKCTFGIEERMFLGYKVSTMGLKVCPDKVEAVLSLPSPKCLKDVQRKSDFHWTTEAEEAFKQMKQLIVELPMLVAPMEKEELIIYLAAAKETVSAVLMTEREAKQMPIYFVSRALRDPEVNYTSMENLALALVHAIERLEEESPDTLMGEEEELPEPWILFTDGSSCTDGSGAGLILTNPKGIEFTYALRFRFDATNNEAEYESLIAGLKFTEQMGVKNLQVNVDSRLVANEVNETYVAKETDMVRYLEMVKTLTTSFKAFSIKQVPRSKNKKADALSKIASTSFAYVSKQVLVEELKEKSISAVEVLAVVEEEGDTWMTLIFKYLMDGTLPVEVKKAIEVKHKSWRMHAGTRFIVVKAFWIGYYWLAMHEDARKLIRAFQDCQVHKPVPRSPQQKLSPITSPWPFYKWGIDIAGPFPEGPGKVKILIDNIVRGFRLPGEIISDNGKQFQDNPFKDWCEKLCIRQHFASVKHSQTNGLVERANRSLGEGIKARTEAVIPAEIGMPTLRTAEVDLVQNNEALEINLDLLEERREQAAIREAKSKAKIKRYYNSKVSE